MIDASSAAINPPHTAAPDCADETEPEERRKILVVLHQENSSPGRIGRLLRDAGMELDIRLPRYGDPLPAELTSHAGAIVFGGPMSANDEDDYLRREIDWIGVPLRERKPFMGICLGAQMLARHLGHRVYRHPQGKVEIGYHPIGRQRQVIHAATNNFLSKSISGIVRDSTCRAARPYSPKARNSRCRRSAMSGPSASSSIRKSPTR